MKRKQKITESAVIKIRSLRLFLIGLTVLGCSKGTAPEYHFPPLEKIVVTSRGEKIHQLVGDFDRERQDSTLNRTGVRYHLFGTDLGIPFPHNGRTYLLFGDSFGGANPADDAIAYTQDTHPEDGIELTLLTKPDGSYQPITIPGIDQGGFEVPMEGISIKGKMYVYHTTDWDPVNEIMGRTVLARSDDDGQTFTALYDFSTERFINVSVVRVDCSEWPGLPDDKGEGLLIFGTGDYRKSSVYLAYQRADEIEDPSKIKYYTDLDNEYWPMWSIYEYEAYPLLDLTGMGELSVAFYPVFDKWVMLFNLENPRGIHVKTADEPWGPWSPDEVILFNEWQDGAYGSWIHVSWEYAKLDSVHDPGRENEWGGAYGPYMFPGLALDDSSTLTLYFTLSTWNPYTVVLMKASLGKE